VTVEPPENVGNGEKHVAQFAELRKLLIGPEQRRLDELSEELDARELTVEELADRLPEAIALSGSRDEHLGRALAPTVETALRESIRRDPQDIADAIFPVLGPAIRKAIAETMAALVHSINSAVEHSLSVQGIKWRIEAWRTGVAYPEIVIKHSLVYRVEQAFLIHAETGLLLAHVSAPDLSVPDADLISGMLTAIQDFVRDSFRPGEGATLRTFSVGEHTIQVEAGPDAVLAEVIRGQAPEEVLRRQQYTLETIHLQFASQLADYSGDSSQFEPARPLLEDCLETVVATTKSESGRRLMWLRWALPLILLALVGGSLWLRSGLRWHRALDTLNAEPGLVVVNASREWRTWHISGLKDPMAREPAAVLAAADLIPHALSGRWVSYLSLDSQMVATRARKMLALPPPAAVSLRADTLVVSGQVSIESIARTRQALPPGVAYVDFHAARPTLPARLDALRQSLESALILFDPGSFAFTQSGEDRVRSVAALFHQLDDSVARFNASVGMELSGRTDPTGTDEANHALAQMRVSAVVGRLGSSGIELKRIVRNPVATARPFSAPDPQEQAKINRSVSFRVIVSAGPPVPREK